MLRNLISFRNIDIKINKLLKEERKINKKSTQFQRYRYSKYKYIRISL